MNPVQLWERTRHRAAVRVTVKFSEWNDDGLEKPGSNRKKNPRNQTESWDRGGENAALRGIYAQPVITHSITQGVLFMRTN